MAIGCNFAGFLKLMEVGEGKKVSEKFEQVGMGEGNGSLPLIYLFIPHICKSSYVKNNSKTNTTQDYFAFYANI